MSEQSKPGGGPVTRFEGSAEEMKLFLDALAAGAGGDPLLLDFRTLVDKVDALDQANGDVELGYEFFMVSPRGSPVTVTWTATLVGENEVPPVMNEMDPAAIVDLVQAHMDGSSVTDLARVVGPYEAQAAIAIPGYQDYTLRSKPFDAPASSASEADFILIV
jgi:hypothetical protein